MGALPPVFVEFVALTGAFKTATKGVTREIQRVERAGGGGFAKMGAVGKAALLGVGAAATIAAVKSISMATSFQAEMNLLVTATGEAKSRMAGLQSGVLEIARATGVSTDQLAKGLYIVEKAGIRGADALKVTKAAAQASVAEGVDLQTMTNALTSVMQTYNIKAKDTVAVQNQIIVAAGESKTTMAMFANSLSTVLPKAKAAGLSFADAAGALATLTQHGTTADQATQDLQNTIVNLASPSRVAINAMQQMGVNVIDLQKNLGKRGLAGTMDYLVNVVAKHMGKDGLVFVDTFKKSASAATDLKSMLDTMSPSLKKLSEGFLNGTVSMKDYRKGIRDMGAEGYSRGSQFLALSTQVKGFNDLLRSGNPAARTFSGALKSMVGGTTALNTYLMLTGDNMPGFRERVDRISAAAHGAGKNIMRWSDVSGTLKNRLARLHQMVDTTMIAIGMKLIPVVIRAADWLGVRLSRAIQNVHQWFDRNRKMIMAVAHVLGAVLKLAFDTLIISIRALSSIVQGIIHFFEKHKAIAVGLAAAVGFLTAVWLAQAIALKIVYLAAFIFAKAQMLVNAAMDANPILLIVAAIIGLAVGLIYAYKHSERFRNIVNTVGRALKTVWTGVLKPVVEFFKNHWKTALTIAVAALMPLVGVPLLLIEHWHAVLDFFKALPKNILKLFVGANKWMFNVGMRIIRGLIDGQIAMARQLWDWFIALPGVLLRLLAKAGSWLVKIGKAIITGLLNGIKSLAMTIWQWFVDLPGHIWDLMQDAGQWLWDVGRAVMMGLWNGMKDVWHDATGWLSNLNPASWFNDINPYKGHAIVNLFGVGQDVFRGLHNGMKSEWSQVTSWLRGINPAGEMVGGSLGVNGLSPRSLLSGGGQSVVNVNVHVQGTVVAERDLANAVQEQMLRMGLRRGASRTYQSFSKAGG